MFVFESCSFRLLNFLLLYGYAYICSIFYTNVLRMYYFSFCPLPKIVLSPFRCFRLSLFDRNQSHTLFNNIIEGSRKTVFDWQYPYATDYFPTMNPRYSNIFWSTGWWSWKIRSSDLLDRQYTEVALCSIIII